MHVLSQQPANMYLIAQHRMHALEHAVLYSGVLLFSAVSSECFFVFFIFPSLFLHFLHPCVPQPPAKKSLSSVEFSFQCRRGVQVQFER